VQHWFEHWSALEQPFALEDALCRGDGVRMIWLA
jgi:hypothetical protein